jgi:MerR family redox-sensitive transcriptional activator SoxR
MRIGDVARQSGLSTSAIRYYEAEGLLPQSSRTSGRREFDAKTVDRLQLIAAAQKFGFRLSEIREMLKVTDGKEPKGGWRSWVKSKVEEIDADMEQMRHARELLVRSLECACQDLATCGKTCEWIETAPSSTQAAPDMTARQKRA